MAANTKSCPWIKQLLTEDFAAGCKEDHFCVTCVVTFCSHCCARNHRGQGHEVVVAAAASSSEGAKPGTGPGCSGDRDSFCLDCTVGFFAVLCAHRSGHSTVRIVVCKGRDCIRCTGSESWFSLFYGIQMYEDEQGNKLVPWWLRCGGARGAH